MKHHVDAAAFGHRVWPARADPLTLIRHEVRRWLGPLEMMPEVEADLVLAVNEAASNVIDHAYRTPGYRAVIDSVPGHPLPVTNLADYATDRPATTTMKTRPGTWSGKSVPPVEVLPDGADGLQFERAEDLDRFERVVRPGEDADGVDLVVGCVGGEHRGER